jgi:cell division protein FtsQ
VSPRAPKAPPRKGRAAAPAARRRNVRRAPGADAAARRAAVQRRMLAWAGAGLLLGGTCAGLAWGTVALKAHGFFQVRDIAFEGHARIAEDQLLARLTLPEGIDLPDVDLDAVSRAVLSHPWIERVRVRRFYPDALNIRVWERTPVAVLARGAKSRGMMVDAEGVLLGPPDPGAAGLPRLTGVPYQGLSTGDRVPTAPVLLGVRVARAWGSPGALVDVADPEDPLLLADGMRVRLGAQGGYGWRLARLAALGTEIAALAGRNGAEVDLRYDDRVIARPL